MKYFKMKENLFININEVVEVEIVEKEKKIYCSTNAKVFTYTYNTEADFWKKVSQLYTAMGLK